MRWGRLAVALNDACNGAVSGPNLCADTHASILIGLIIGDKATEVQLPVMG
jgi:hypothetical protein